MIQHLFRGLNPSSTNQPNINQLTSGHLLTDLPIHKPLTHRLTDPLITVPTDKILFKRINIKRYPFNRTQTQWENVKLYFILLFI